MAHVTFIHGIANKPPTDELQRIWRESLAAGGLDLDTEGVTSSMIYWADVLYPAPRAEAEAPESIAEMDVDGGAATPAWEAALDGDEERWVAALGDRLGAADGAGLPGGANENRAEADAPPPAATAAAVLERVPLPWFVKRRLMRILLRDVHHYLFDTEHSPRDGETYRVQQEIRRRAVDTLAEGAAAAPPHVVLSHSMGTVIAYDCLKRVPDCPRVDTLVTVGSPLGLDEIQDKLAPEWSRDDGYPAAKVGGVWVNVFDRLDPVAAFDAKLADDYRRGGEPAVIDIHEENWGRWRHSIDKYLRGAELVGRLRAALGFE